MDLQLKGRTALVTGSDRRTGEVIAENGVPTPARPGRR